MENEKIKKKNVLAAVLIALGLLAIGMSVEAGLMNNQQTSKSVEVSTQTNNDIDQMSMFLADITFILLVDDGCGCNPIPNATILAGGGGGWDEGTTDKDGQCVLQLEINEIYWIQIDADNFRSIDFEFDVIDDQTFTFLLDKTDTSRDVTTMPRILNLFEAIKSILSR
jgi:hypothetical protein